MILLAHISDLHLDGGGRAAERASRVMTFLDTLAAPVDAVLLTGDIADHGLVAEYDEARAILGRRHRILSCPGNHDDRATYRKVLLDEPPSDEPINQVHDVGWLRVAMCDSSIPGQDDGFLSDQTLSWLTDVLARTPEDMRAVVAFHHPPVILHSPFIDAIRQHGEERLATLLGAYPRVAAVLCGHAHTAAATTLAGRPLLVAPGVVSTLRLPWETDTDLDYSMPPSIAFHILDDDGRITTHYRLC